MEFKILNADFEYRVDANNILKSVLQNEKGQPIFRSNLTWKIKDQAIKDQINNVAEIENVQKLPEIGQPVTEGVLYTGHEIGLIKCRQSHNRTIYAIEDVPALFSFYRENTDELEWIPNEEVELGWKRIYERVQYEVIQAHMTLETWTPPATPALWNAIIEEPVSSEWTVGVDYTIGDVVTYQGAEYECRQSHTSQAGWTPSAVLSLWLPL